MAGLDSLGDGGRGAASVEADAEVYTVRTSDMRDPAVSKTSYVHRAGIRTAASHFLES